MSQTQSQSAAVLPTTATQADPPTAANVGGHRPPKRDNTTSADNPFEVQIHNYENIDSKNTGPGLSQKEYWEKKRKETLNSFGGPDSKASHLDGTAEASKTRHVQVVVNESSSDIKDTVTNNNLSNGDDLLQDNYNNVTGTSDENRNAAAKSLSSSIRNNAQDGRNNANTVFNRHGYDVDYEVNKSNQWNTNERHPKSSSNNSKESQLMEKNMVPGEYQGLSNKEYWKLVNMGVGGNVRLQGEKIAGRSQASLNNNINNNLSYSSKDNSENVNHDFNDLMDAPIKDPNKYKDKKTDKELGYFTSDEKLLEYNNSKSNDGPRVKNLDNNLGSADPNSTDYNPYLTTEQQNNNLGSADPNSTDYNHNMISVNQQGHAKIFNASDGVSSVLNSNLNSSNSNNQRDPRFALDDGSNPFTIEVAHEQKKKEWKRCDDSMAQETLARVEANKQRKLVWTGIGGDNSRDNSSGINVKESGEQKTVTENQNQSYLHQMRNNHYKVDIRPGGYVVGGFDKYKLNVA